jgi:hypothetical protein
MTAAASTIARPVGVTSLALGEHVVFDQSVDGPVRRWGFPEIIIDGECYRKTLRFYAEQYANQSIRQTWERLVEAGRPHYATILAQHCFVPVAQWAPAVRGGAK